MNFKKKNPIFLTLVIAFVMCAVSCHAKVVEASKENPYSETINGKADSKSIIFDKKDKIINIELNGMPYSLYHDPTISNYSKGDSRINFALIDTNNNHILYSNAHILNYAIIIDQYIILETSIIGTGTGVQESYYLIIDNEGNTVFSKPKNVIAASLDGETHHAIGSIYYKDDGVLSYHITYIEFNDNELISAKEEITEFDILNGFTIIE